MIKRSLDILITLALGIVAITNGPVLQKTSLFNLGRQSESKVTQVEPSAPSLHSDIKIAQTDTISDDVWEMLNQAQAAEASNQLDQAASLYREILSKPLPQATRVDVTVLWGNTLYQQQKFQDAIAAYETAKQLDPKNIKSWVGQAKSLYALDDLDSAKQALEDARERLPGEITTLVNFDDYATLSATFRQFGEFATSISLLETALRLNPYIANAGSCTFTQEGLNYLGIELGVLTQKYRSARCSLGAFPPDGPIKTWTEVASRIDAAVQSQDIYTESYERTGLRHLVSIIPHSLFEPETPEDRLNEAIAISALNLGTGLMNRAITMGHTDSMDAAIAFLYTSVQHDPSYAWNQIYLSSALLAQGRVDDAMKHANQALAIPQREGDEPGNTWVWAHNHLGYALEQQGLREAAIREYQKAIALDPQFKPAQDNLKRISLTQS